MQITVDWKVKSPQTPLLRSSQIYIYQIILLLAMLIITATSIVSISEDGIIIASIEVFAVPSCRQIGKTTAQSKKYPLPNNVCVDIPPLPGINNRLLSYEISIPASVNATTCFFDAYPKKKCQGNYSGYQLAPNNEVKCENVLQSFTGVQETFGAESGQLSCVVQIE